jgi:hypothetical protein
VDSMHHGLRVVWVEQIAGSVGRCSEFDPVFLPLRESARTKWERIDRAFHRGEVLPPVKVYKVGNSYFALDGNHRISVARFQGVEFIDAEVTEFTIPSASEPTHTATFDELPGRKDPKMDEISDPRGGIEVSWGLEEDEEGIAELMDLNGMRRALAFEEQFVVAERGGKILAALRLAVQRLHLAHHSSPVPKQPIRTQTEQSSGDTEDAG